MVRVRDASALLGVLVTHPVSRPPVRPLADEAMRSLPGDGLVADAKIRWNHAITIGSMQRRQLLHLKRLVETA